MTKNIKEVQRGQSFRREESRGLFFGVNDFADPAIPNLNFAVDDAIDLAFLFSCELELILPARINLALAGIPRKPETEDKLEWLRNAGAGRVEARGLSVERMALELGRTTGENGLWALSFSSHGFSTRDGHTNIAVADSWWRRIAESGISVDRLLDDIAEASTTRRLLLVDACRSHLGGDTRGSGGTSGGEGMSQSFLQALEGSSGLAFLISTTQGGQSYEHPSLGNGVFSDAVIRGLRGQATPDANGFITVGSLVRYLNQEVIAWVRNERPEHLNLSRGISYTIEGLAAELPLASSDSKEVDRRDHARLRELGLVRLRRYVGPVISGTEFDDIQELARSGEPTPELIALLRGCVGLDGTPKAEQVFKDAFRRLGLSPGRQLFRHGIDQMYGLKGAVDESGAQASFLASAETGDPVGRAWLVRLHLTGLCSFPRDPAATRFLGRADLAALKARAERGEGDAALVLGFAFIDGVGVEVDLGRAGALLRIPAQQGDTVAMNCLGWLQEQGGDPAAAAQWYRQSADGGNPMAMRNLANSYLAGSGVPKDEVAAAEWYRRSAERGNALAMKSLGFLYRNGQGVARDDSIARQWFRRSAERGDAEAMTDLGLMALEGEGGTQDSEEALRCFQQGAEKGNTFAMRLLGALYADGDVVAKDFGRALSLWLQAAALNDVISLLTLGEIYDAGTGVPSQPAFAADFFRRAAEAGNAEAAARLARLYSSGRGVPKDYSEAARWRQFAAERGSAEAMFELAGMYQHGLGVQQNSAQALLWYQKAAAGGHAMAMYDLGVFYQQGILQPQDFAKALHWYSLAVQGGVAGAMNNLGVMYEYGQGVTRDPQEAVRWYGQAADQGEALGMFNLGCAYKDGNGVPKDLAKARAWLQRAGEHGYAGAWDLLKVVGDGGIAENLAQMWRKWLS